MRKIVADTGPILHLYEASLEHLLPQAGEILLPPAVLAELSSLTQQMLSKPAGARVSREANLSDFLERAHAPLMPTADEEAARWQAAGLLDRGEAEALALARQVRADWFLTDDAAARLLASQLGLEAHGSLGVVLWAAATRRFDHPAATKALEDLASSSLWVSRRVLAEAAATLDELFS